MKLFKRYLTLIIASVLPLHFSCKDTGVGPTTGNWKLLGLEGKVVSQLKLIDNHLYACAGRDGLFRVNITSINKYWEYLGLADAALESGVTDVVSLNGHLLVSYVAGDQSQKRGVYRSSDAGVTWLASDSGMITTTEYPTTSQVIRLRQSPTNPSHVLAGTTVDLIYLSTDSGIIWRKIFGTLGASAINYSICFSNASASEIWVGGETGFFAPYLLHSSDGGESWSDIWFPPDFGLGPDNAVYDIAIDPTNDSVLYFGMLGMIGKTTNKGETFQRILGWEDGIYPHWRLAINPSNPQELLATGFFLYRTTDGGKSWQRITPPDNRNGLYALAVDWQQRVLFVSASSPGNGIYKLRF